MREQWVIHGGDNAFGQFGRDVDDAIATLYLLGRPELRLLALTTVFGNAPLRRTTRSAQALLRAAGRADLPVIAGAACAGDGDTPAADYLARTVAANPGRIALLATGPLTNVAGALRLHPGFLHDLAGLYCMGGRFTPLRVGWRQAGELNFAADPLAAHRVLSRAPRLTLVPSEVCVQVAWNAEVLHSAGALHPRLRTVLATWLRAYGLGRGVRAFHPWDLLPAVAITHPGLFHSRVRPVALQPVLLAGGWLAEPGPHPLRCVQQVVDPKLLTRLAFAALQQAWPAPQTAPQAGPVQCVG